MKNLINEYGTYMISAVIGLVFIRLGAGMFTLIAPMIQAYVLSLI